MTNYLKALALSIGLIFSMSCADDSTQLQLSDSTRTSTRGLITSEDPCSTGVFKAVDASFTVSDFYNSSVGRTITQTDAAGFGTSWNYTHYANNIKYKWNVYTSPSFVSSLQVFDTLALANNDDEIRFVSNAKVVSRTSVNNSVFDPNSNEEDNRKLIELPWIQNTNKANKYTVTWESGQFGNNSVGWNLGGVLLKCGIQGNLNHDHINLRSKEPADILLGGTNDTVHFKMNLDNDRPEDVIFIDLETRNGSNDFNPFVVASWGNESSPKYPTSSPFEFSTIDAPKEENDTLVIDTNGNENSTLWITVSSSDGSGHVRLRATEARTKTMKVSYGNLAGRPGLQWNVANNRQLYTYSRSVFAATDGEFLIDKWIIVDGGQLCSDCDVWMHRNDDLGSPLVCNSDTPGLLACCSSLSSSEDPGIIKMPFDAWWTANGRRIGGVFAHEWGHCYANYGEEYKVDAPYTAYSLCGHSAMGSGFSFNWGVDDFCVSRGHAKDPQRGLVSASGTAIAGPSVPAQLSALGSVWSYMSTYADIAYPPGVVSGMNPDPYPYYKPAPSSAPGAISAFNNDILFDDDIVTIVKD